VNTRSIAATLSGLLLCFFCADVPEISAQSSGIFKTDANWAQLPDGKTWDGSASWITAMVRETSGTGARHHTFDGSRETADSSKPLAKMDCFKRRTA
jgi:hypothetical protein